MIVILPLWHGNKDKHGKKKKVVFSQNSIITNVTINIYVVFDNTSTHRFNLILI